jgi:hypothetical protein
VRWGTGMDMTLRTMRANGASSWMGGVAVGLNPGHNPARRGAIREVGGPGERAALETVYPRTVKVRLPVRSEQWASIDRHFALQSRQWGSLPLVLLKGTPGSSDTRQWVGAARSAVACADPIIRRAV